MWMGGSDQELVGQMLDGGEEAFAELYRRHQGPVFRFALHMTGCVPVAEDVTQEVFLVLMVHTRRFDVSRGTVRSFLFGIARNHVMRRLEQERGAHQEPEDFDPADDSDALEEFTRRQTIEDVRRAVLSLPQVYREAVALCDLEDATYEEAAGILECPVGTVRSRLNRGRRMLARKLAPLAEARTV